MKIKKYDDLNCIAVTSSIYFDQKDCFCDRPYVYLNACKKNRYGQENYIVISIKDLDDFDLGVIYRTSEKDFENILHDLINWMRDHEQGITYYDEIWHPLKFFPDYNCYKDVW